MGISAEDLREFVIRPTLLLLNDWSHNTENLLVGTAAQESNLGCTLQSCNHSGTGLYRISAHTHLEVWDKYLVTDPESASRVRGLASQQQFLKSPHAELISNLSYATAIAWMVYKRHQLLIPDNLNTYELGKYWLDYYCKRDSQCDQAPHDQTIHSNNACVDQFVESYDKLVSSNNTNNTLAA